MFISYSPAEKKRALFFEFRTIIPLENHGFSDRPFLPFEVGRARANAMITLACLKLTTWLGCGSAVNEPIFAVLNQLANLNGLKGQLINLASILRWTYPRVLLGLLWLFLLCSVLNTRTKNGSRCKKGIWNLYDESVNATTLWWIRNNGSHTFECFSLVS